MTRVRVQPTSSSSSPAERSFASAHIIAEPERRYRGGVHDEGVPMLTRLGKGACAPAPSHADAYMGIAGGRRLPRVWPGAQGLNDR
jgi:hypothetical protein